MVTKYGRVPWKLTPFAVVDADGNTLISRGDQPQDDEICQMIVDNTNEAARLRAALDIAVSRGCDHCAESIQKARALVGGLA